MLPREAAVPVCPPALPKAAQPHNHLRPHGPTFATYRAVLPVMVSRRGLETPRSTSQIDLLHVLIYSPSFRNTVEAWAQDRLHELANCPARLPLKRDASLRRFIHKTAHLLWTMHKTFQTQDTFSLLYS